MKKTPKRDLFPGALEMMILQTLRRQPSHGYALVQHIKQTSHDLLQIEEGSLYPALQRLLKKNWSRPNGVSLLQIAAFDIQTDGSRRKTPGTRGLELRAHARRDTHVLAPGES